MEKPKKKRATFWLPEQVLRDFKAALAREGLYMGPEITAFMQRKITELSRQENLNDEHQAPMLPR